jgi:acylphosphatase
VERRQIYFSGRVQGVGFRYTAREIAARFSVQGFVRNLADGRVELVVEGEADELDRFLAALAAEMGRFIASQESTTTAATRAFSGFEVRR